MLSAKADQIQHGGIGTSLGKSAPRKKKIRITLFKAFVQKGHIITFWADFHFLQDLAYTCI